MTSAEFETYYRLYADDIRGVARYLVRNDDDLVEDLFQEGLIGLWKLDLSKIQKNERALIRQHARHRMIDFLRVQRRETYESLTALLAQGDQIVRTDDGSAAVMPRNRRTRWEAEIDEENWTSDTVMMGNRIETE